VKTRELGLLSVFFVMGSITSSFIPMDGGWMGFAFWVGVGFAFSGGVGSLLLGYMLLRVAQFVVEGVYLNGFFPSMYQVFKPEFFLVHSTAISSASVSGVGLYHYAHLSSSTAWILLYLSFPVFVAAMMVLLFYSEVLVMRLGYVLGKRMRGRVPIVF
jgi:hypothetical protein